MSIQSLQPFRCSIQKTRGERHPPPPPVRLGLNSSADIKQVRRLYDNIEQNCRGLKALGVTSESYGALLVPVLLHKLPEDIRLEVSREMGKTSEEENQWDLDKILKQFKDEIEARKRCTPMNVPGHSAYHGYKKPVYNRTAPSTASALLSSSNRKSYSCKFCRESHSTAECAEDHILLQSAML